MATNNVKPPDYLDILLVFIQKNDIKKTEELLNQILIYQIESVLIG